MMPGRLKSVFSLIGPPTLYFSYAYTLFFKHFYRLMLLNSCIALLFFFFACWWRVFSLQRCRLQGGEEFSLPVVHSHFFIVHCKNRTMALLWFSSIYLLCLSSTFYLLGREGGAVRIAKNASPFFSGKYFCDVHSKKVFVQLLSICCGCVPSLLCGHCFAHVSLLLITSCRYPCERCQTCNGTPSSGCDRLFLELQKHILKAGGGHAHLLNIPPPPQPFFFFRALKTAFMQLLIFSCLSI